MFKSHHRLTAKNFLKEFREMELALEISSVENQLHDVLLANFSSVTSLQNNLHPLLPHFGQINA